MTVGCNEDPIWARTRLETTEERVDLDMVATERARSLRHRHYARLFRTRSRDLRLF